QVYHREQQVPDLFGDCIRGRRVDRLPTRRLGGWTARRLGRQRVLNLRQLLPHLRRGPRGIGPVEAHARRPFLEPVRQLQTGEGGGEPVQDSAALPLPALERLPLLTRPKVEQVRVTPPHLALEVAGHILR